MTARTLTEILTTIRQAWIDNATLAALYDLEISKTWDEQFSKVSLESLLTYIMAYATFIYENIVYDLSASLEALIEAKHEFSIPWYTAVARAFQLGDELVLNATTYAWEYPTIDETKQIVKFTTIRQRQIEGVTKLQIYATKEGKAAMTADELAAFRGYMTDRGAAGTHFQFISLDPDRLKIYMTVYYDPQLLSSIGQSLSTGEFVVNNAIVDFLSNIRYGGVYNRTRQIDAVQAVSGVRDVELGDVFLNEDLMSAREFESASGFYQADLISITYTPQHDN